MTKLRMKNIDVSLFIEPDKKQIKAAQKLGVQMIELHTGRYADSRTASQVKRNLSSLLEAAEYAHDLGLVVNAGHGLDYKNVTTVARLPYLNELNIGYSIICRSVFTGLRAAVKEMKSLIRAA